MNVSQSAAGIALTAVNQMLNLGSLVFYSGTNPGAESALSANTALVTFAFQSAAFGAPSFSSSFEQETASFVATSVAPSAAGTAAFARGYVWVWTASTAVVVGQYTTNGTNLYQCITAGTTAASGGPTGTTASITDGTAVWKYVSAVSDVTDSRHVVADYTIGTTGTDIVIGSTSINTGVNVTLSSFLHKLAAV
ncbi:MAG: hypothetical protein NVSMB20_03240 [Bradyrhizobium sp.]